MEKLVVQSMRTLRRCRIRRVALLLVSAMLLVSRPLPARGSTGRSDGAYFYDDRVVVLTYHDVQTMPTGEWSVTPEKFEQTMNLLRRVGFTFISPADFAAFVEKSAAIPPNALLLTFDDGLEDMYLYAFPILQRLRIPCLLNVIGSRVDASASCVTTGQIGDMVRSGLVWVGGHSFGLHCDEMVDDVAVPAAMVLHEDETEFMRMMRLWDDAARCQNVAETVAGADSPFYACPYGCYDDTYLSTLQRAGFQFVFNSQPGAVRAGQDPLRLPRVDIGHQRYSFLQVVMAIRCGAIGNQLPLWQAGRVVLSHADTPQRFAGEEGDDLTAVLPGPSATP